MIKIIRYNSIHKNFWDTFCQNSNNAIFQNMRDYLEYKEIEKYSDHSLLLLDDDTLVALLPAAQVDRTVISHPFTAHGGIITENNLSHSYLEKLWAGIINYFFKNNLTSIRIKSKFIDQNFGSDSLESFILLSKGFNVYESNLNSVVYLNNPTQFSSRKKRNLKKFEGTYLLSDQNNLKEIYDLIQLTLKNYHGVSPTHSFKELKFLVKTFPKNIELFSAVVDDEISACSVVYKYNKAWHTQYLASSELGRKNGALDSLLVLIGHKAKDVGCTHLSFGISTENNGKVLNNGLFNYKQEFGATARINLTLELTK